MSSIKDQFIERIEFRVFLIALKQRFEYFEAFKRIDSSGDGKISISEFIAAKDNLEQWVGTLADPWSDFRTIDDDNSGFITFDEFCDWSIKKNLDMDSSSPHDSCHEKDGEEDITDIDHEVIEEIDNVAIENETHPSHVDINEHHYDDGL